MKADSQRVKRLVALESWEYKLAQELSEGIGFSGYAAIAIREKMAKDLKQRDSLEAHRRP